MPTLPPMFKPHGQPSKPEYARARRVRDSWRAWFGTAKWKAIRAAQLTRQPTCERCGMAPATTANHRRPHRGDPGLFWGGALESVCASCHSSTIQREENRSRGGYGG